jgi:hypothetical protein
MRTSFRAIRNDHWTPPRVQRPVLPLGHALDDLVGDRGDRLPRDLGSVDLAQVGLDLAGGQPLGRQRDDQLVDTGQTPLTFGDDLRFEGGVTVTRDVDLDRSDLGQHGLGAVPVAGIAAITPGRVVAVVAQVIGDLSLQRGLDQALRELGEQPVLTGELQTARTGPPGQAGDQLLIDRIQTLTARGLNAHELVQVHCPLGCHVRHQVHPP